MFARHVMTFLCFAASCAFAGQPDPPAPPKPEVKEDELQRVARSETSVFPWANTKPAPPVKADTKAAGGAIEITGDVLIRAMGSLTRIAPKDGPYAGKEVLTLTGDVEIDHLQTQSTLRGQSIKVVRDLKTGRAETLEARGKVEVVQPERKGRGEALLYETQYTPEGQLLKDLYTLEGNRDTGARATLWQGEDVIEADKFVNDRRLDTFRVSGNPVAVVNVPADPTAPRKETAKSGGLLPGFAVNAGGKIRMKAEGEMFYEGPAGRVRITRNVAIQQDEAGPGGGVAMIMHCDEALLSLLLPPPGQTPAQNSVFSGSLRGLECNGRLEIMTVAQTVLCDRGVLDMQRKTFVMEMRNPKEEVRIFMREAADDGTQGGKVILAPRLLKVFMESGEIEAGGPQRVERFSGPPPTNRGPMPLPKK